MTQSERTVRFEEVSELLPELWGGQRAVYFCDYCQQEPPVEEGEVAVSVAHDACTRSARDRGLARFGVLNNYLVNRLLELDPDIEI